MLQQPHQYTLTEKEEFVKCAMDPKHFIETYVTMYNKENGGYGAAKLFPHLEKMLTDVQQHQQNTFFKYRQAGCTSLALAYMVYYLTFNHGKQCLLISGNLHQATNLMDNVRRMISSLPPFLRPRTVVGGNSQKVLIFENGNQLNMQNISRDGIRGFSPDVVIIDEFMYAQHLEEWMCSFIGSVNPSSTLIAISSPRFGLKVPGFFNSGNVRCFQWYQDPRYNQDLWWEQDIHGEHGNYIGTAKISNVPEAEHLTLLRKGYLPQSSWSQKLRKDVMSEEMASEYFNSDFYGHE